MVKKPILYYATLSQPSRSVLLTAKAIGLELDLRPISLFKGENLTAEFIKMNPQHTIPTLDDNGVYIGDSHAICAYLVTKYAKDDKLYPKDPAKRALVDSRLYFDTGYLFARLRFLFEPILYFGSPDVPADKIELLHKALGIMEDFLKDHPYVAGDNLSIADLCCIATISSIGEEFVPMDKVKYANVLEWIERMSKLPYYKINHDGAEEFKQIFKDKLVANRSNA